MGKGDPESVNRALRGRLKTAMAELYKGKPPAFKVSDAKLREIVESLEVNLETARFFFLKHEGGGRCCNSLGG